MTETVKRTWYLSFATEAEFLGGLYVMVDEEGDEGMLSAVKRAHELGMNPGGGVMGWDISEFDPSWIPAYDRLLSKDEIIDATEVDPDDFEALGIRTLEQGDVHED